MLFTTQYGADKFSRLIPYDRHHIWYWPFFGKSYGQDEKPTQIWNLMKMVSALGDNRVAYKQRNDDYSYTDIQTWLQQIMFNAQSWCESALTIDSILKQACLNAVAYPNNSIKKRNPIKVDLDPHQWAGVITFCDLVSLKFRPFSINFYLSGFNKQRFFEYLVFAYNHVQRYYPRELLRPKMRWRLAMQMIPELSSFKEYLLSETFLKSTAFAGLIIPRLDEDFYIGERKTKIDDMYSKHLSRVYTLAEKFIDNKTEIFGYTDNFYIYPHLEVKGSLGDRYMLRYYVNPVPDSMDTFEINMRQLEQTAQLSSLYSIVRSKLKSNNYVKIRAYTPIEIKEINSPSDMVVGQNIITNSNGLVSIKPIICYYVSGDKYMQSNSLNYFFTNIPTVGIDKWPILSLEMQDFSRLIHYYVALNKYWNVFSVKSISFKSYTF